MRNWFWWICGGESGLPILLLHYFGTGPLSFILLLWWIQLVFRCWNILASLEYCLIQLANILWRIFASKFIRNIYIWLSCLVVSLSGYTIRVMCVCVCSVMSLCEPMDCSPPGSSVHWIFQAGMLEQVATSYCRGLPNPGTQSDSLVSPALAGRFFATVPTGKPIRVILAS